MNTLFYIVVTKKRNKKSSIMWNTNQTVTIVSFNMSYVDFKKGLFRLLFSLKSPVEFDKCPYPISLSQRGGGGGGSSMLVFRVASCVRPILSR